MLRLQQRGAFILIEIARAVLYRLRGLDSCLVESWSRAHGPPFAAVALGPRPKAG